ncbi:MAG: hypothetical protein ACRCSN_04790 [Dermatophilaceae bacterium]
MNTIDEMWGRLDSPEAHEAWARIVGGNAWAAMCEEKTSFFADSARVAAARAAAATAYEVTAYADDITSAAHTAAATRAADAAYAYAAYAAHAAVAADAAHVAPVARQAIAECERMIALCEEGR